MRKSLGEKRKQISDTQIIDIVRLYDDFEQNDRCKIFDNEDFGFLRVTVERPLRQRWEVTDTGIEALRQDKKLAKLDDDTRRPCLRTWGSTRLERRQRRNPSPRKEGDAGAGLRGKPIENAIVDALAIADPDAPIVTDPNGKLQPDADPPRRRERAALRRRRRPHPLRARRHRTPRHEAVSRTDRLLPRRRGPPLRPRRLGRFHEDEDRLRDPLTRHFYTYTPPRRLEEIDAEIKALEVEIQDLLAEVTE
ncbi:MAG: hypothetical protein R2706_11350 [Acidimicrobiales bacterium]